MAKIIKAEENLIEFDNGVRITASHCQVCCGDNYADCEQLDDLARGYDFNTSQLVFEAVEYAGFRFGDNPNRMFFVPCYSEQNGYYSCYIDIFLDGELRANFECEECFC